MSKVDPGVCPSFIAREAIKVTVRDSPGCITADVSTRLLVATGMPLTTCLALDCSVRSSYW